MESVAESIGTEMHFQLVESDEDFVQTDRKFDSLCFGEGAMQSFELNFERFQRDEPLRVQTHTRFIIEALVKQINGDRDMPDSCRTSIDGDFDRMREAFMMLEVSFGELRGQYSAEGEEEKDRLRLEHELVSYFQKFQEQFRGLKAHVFEDAAQTVYGLEERGRRLEFEVDAVNRNKREGVLQLILGLTEEFKVDGDMTLFNTLVRKSEDWLENAQAAADKLKVAYFDRFEEMNRDLSRSVSEDLNSVALKLNRLFWNHMNRDYRSMSEGEKTCDYVKFLISIISKNFSSLEKALKKHELWEKKWKQDGDFVDLVGKLEKSFPELEGETKLVWSRLKDEIVLLWEEQMKVIDETQEEESHVSLEDLEEQIVELPQMKGNSSNLDAELLEKGVCEDPVRRFLDRFYQEMLDIEIGLNSMESIVSRKRELSEEMQTGLGRVYGYIIELVRAYKGSLDQGLWEEMRGSMKGFGLVSTQWRWVVREMREQWRERVKTKRRTLLIKGVRLQEIQKAIRDHDRWLEQLEDQDEQLFKVEAGEFMQTRHQISRRVRRWFTVEAREVNMELWRILENVDWTSLESLVQMKEQVEKMLTARSRNHDFTHLVEKLRRRDGALQKNQVEINERHLELWNKALMESDLFWEDIIRGIQEEAPEEEEGKLQRLRCSGKETFDSAEEPLNLEETFRKFIYLEVDRELLFKFVFRKVQKSENLYKLLSQFFQGWVEGSREWKASQYERTLQVYLKGHRNLLHLVEEYLRRNEEFGRVRKDNQQEIKRRWILKNDSRRSMELLTKVLQEVDQSWSVLKVSNDQRVGNFKNRLIGFNRKVRDGFTDMAKEMNLQLWRLFLEELEKGKSLEVVVNRVIIRMKKWMETLQTKWLVTLGEIGGRLRFDGSREVGSIEKDLKAGVEDEFRQLQRALDDLEKLEPEEADDDHECVQNLMEEVERPLAKAYEKMIFDELQIGKVREVLWPILGKTKKEKLRVWRRVVGFHQKWVERSRGFKAGVYERTIHWVEGGSPDLEDIFREWSEVVNSSVEVWRRKSKEIVSKYIEEPDGAETITNIRRRTENFINDALEMDAQLKNYYFEDYLRKLPDIEGELAGDYLHLASLINLHYFSMLLRVVEDFKQGNHATSLHNPIFDILEQTWTDLRVWFNEKAPTVSEVSWSETLIGTIESIVEKKKRILREHWELWDVLNKKFELAGPEGVMENIIQEGGKCDVFRLIRGPQIN